MSIELQRLDSYGWECSECGEWNEEDNDYMEQLECDGCAKVFYDFEVL